MNRPIRIGLLDKGWGQWPGGVEYLRNLAFALLKGGTGREVELFLILRERAHERHFAVVPPEVRRVCMDEYAPARFGLAARVRNRLRPRADRRPESRFECLLREHLSLDFAYPCGALELATTRLRWADWAPDFQHKHLSEFFSADEIEARDRQFEDAAQRAPVVVFSSQAALHDFERFYPGGRCETRVLHFRSVPDDEWYAASTEEVRMNYRLPERFFLISNQFWAHKNHKLVLDSLARLKAEDVLPAMVWTGPVTDYRNPGFIDELLQSIQRLGLHEQVRILGKIPKSDQIQLMRACLAVVQPTLFEGWSTVIEEARCFGKTMFVSDLPPNREQNPLYTSYFDPHDADALSELLRDGWANLAPGPDADREARGREENIHNVREFGEAFLDIALPALPPERTGSGPARNR